VSHLGPGPADTLTDTRADTGTDTPSPRTERGNLMRLVPNWARPSWRRQAKAAEKLADALAAGDMNAAGAIVDEHVAAERGRVRKPPEAEAADRERIG
jgi:hypothetical protein